MKSPRVWLPIAIGIVGLLGVTLLVATRPSPEPKPSDPKIPLVRVWSVDVQPHQFVVRAHGTVMPRTESQVVPQVSGPIVWVSPAFVSGGFFEAGEPLLRIERLDYEAALESARAAVARAESEYDRSRKELDRQRRLADRSVSSASRFDDARNAERVSAASLREARSQLQRAERDLERTEILAPYAGRVREEQIDVGEFVSRGTPIGTVYAVDYAEVRLPIPDRELSFLDLRGLDTGAEAELPGPEVVLRASFGGRELHWRGQIVRSEGEIDARTRMVNVVARVEDPYGRARPAPNASDGDARERPAPLAVGLFVQAEIQGQRREQAIALPRTALREQDRVLVVDAESRLRYRDVRVLRKEREQVIVDGGLEAGERVCVSPLQVAVDGMRVRVAGSPPVHTAEPSEPRRDAEPPAEVAS